MKRSNDPRVEYNKLMRSNVFAADRRAGEHRSRAKRRWFTWHHPQRNFRDEVDFV